MFCTKCGKQIPDSTKFCPYCGANCSPEQDIAGQAGQVFNKVEKELGSAFDEVKQSFNGNSNNQNYNQGYNANQNYSNGYNNGTIPPYSGTRLKDDRGLASYIILSIITCGIYSYYFIYKMAHDVNIACDGDGENTSGLVAFVLLSLITCGIMHGSGTIILVTDLQLTDLVMDFQSRRMVQLFFYGRYLVLLSVELDHLLQCIFLSRILIRYVMLTTEHKA